MRLVLLCLLWKLLVSRCVVVILLVSWCWCCFWLLVVFGCGVLRVCNWVLCWVGCVCVVIVGVVIMIVVLWCLIMLIGWICCV